MKKEKFQVEKEKKHYLGEFGPVIGAIVVLIILILLLVFVFKVDITKIGRNDNNGDDNKDSTSSKFQDIVVNPSTLSCDSDSAIDLIDKASNIEISYTNENRVYTQYESDDPDEGMIDISGYMYDVKIENIPDGIYINITNDYDVIETNDVIKTEDIKDGTYIYSFPGYIDYVTFEFTFLSDDTTACPNSVVRRIEFSPDANNIFAGIGLCVDENTRELMKDFEYCKLETIPREKFLTFNEVIKKGNEYLEKVQSGEIEPEEEKDGIIQFIKNNKVVIIIVSIIVIFAIVAIIIIRNNTRKKSA